MKTGYFTRALLTSTVFVVCAASSADVTLSAETAGPVNTATQGGGLGASGTLTVDSTGSVVGTGQIGIVIAPGNTQVHNVRINDNTTTTVTEVISDDNIGVSIAPTAGASTSTITVDASATVNGATNAVSFNNPAGAGHNVTITNSGTITGATNGVYIDNTNGTPSTGTFAITNNSSGTITATGAGSNRAIVVDQSDNAAFTITIANSGTISSTASDAIAFGIVDAAASTNGTITNNEGGSINGGTGSAAGVRFTNASLFKTFTNSGNITGGPTGEGVVFLAGSGITGKFTNNSTGNIGSSASSQDGVRIDTSLINDDFLNAGRIEGSRAGVNINVGSLKNILNTGVIIGGNTATDGGILVTGNTTITNGITNSGTIVGGIGATGAAIDVSAATNPITITNTGTILGHVKLGNGNGTTNLLTLGDGSSIANTGFTAISGKTGVDNRIDITGVGASVSGAIDLNTAAANNIINVNKSFSTGGTITRTNIAVAADATFTVGHAVTAIGLLNLNSANNEIDLLTSGSVKLNDATGQMVTNVDTTITSHFGAGSDTAVAANNVNGKIYSTAQNNTVGGNIADPIKINIVTGEGYIGNGALFNIVENTNDAFNGADNNNVLTGNTATLSFTVSGTSGNNLVIVVSRTPLNEVIAGGLQDAVNAAAVGAAIESNGSALADGAGNVVSDYQRVAGAPASLATPALTREFLNRMAPDVNGSVNIASSQATNAAVGTVVTRMAKLNDGLADVSTGGYYSAGDVRYGHGFWMQGFMSLDRQKNRLGITGFDADTFGLAFGADSLIEDNWRLGASIGGAQSKVESKHKNINRLDIAHISLVGYTQIEFTEQFYADGILSYVYHDYDSNRQIPGAGFDRVALGRYDGHQTSFRIGTGYKMHNENWIVNPNGYFQFSHLNIEEYTETGGGSASLFVNGASVKEAIIAGDMRLTYNDNVEQMVPTVHAGFTYDFIAESHRTTSQFTAAAKPVGAAFVSEGAKIPRFGYAFGFSFMLPRGNGWEFTAAYDFYAKTDFQSHSANLNFRYTW